MVAGWSLGSGERQRERKKGKREKSNLYYFIGLYVKIRNEKLRVLLNELVK